MLGKSTSIYDVSFMCCSLRFFSFFDNSTFKMTLRNQWIQLEEDNYRSGGHEGKSIRNFTASTLFWLTNWN